MYLFSNIFGVWNFGASLQAFKSDITLITSCRHVISIGHTASAVFVAFWQLCHIEKRRIFYGLVKNISLFCIYKFLTHKIIFFSKSQPRPFILKIFLKFRKSQSRYCYKTYSLKKERVYRVYTDSQVFFLLFNSLSSVKCLVEM